MTEQIIWWLILTVIGLYWAIGRHVIHFPGSHNSDLGPIISSLGLLSARRLDSMHVGTLQGFYYNFIYGSNGRVIVFVQLHHDTKLHVIAIGDKSDVMSKISMKTLRRSLSRVELEGNFPDYFKMYCTKGGERELLQIFDPADMAYFVDFCRTHDFELYKDSIYISQAANTHDKNDTTTLIHDIENFLKRNHRLLKRIKADSPEVV